MPFITAREDAGLSRTPSSQDIDAVVGAGQRLAVDWVERQDNGNGLGQIRLAGNYTCPETHNVLTAGQERYVNTSRFEVPADAWLTTNSRQVAANDTKARTGEVMGSHDWNNLITADQCEQIFGHEISQAQLQDLNKCLIEFNISTPIRIAHFMAQIAHESGGLKWLKELADGSQYEWRDDLGNTERGDGPRFKGAGAIQLTGRSNYSRFSKHIGDPRVMEGCDYVASRYPFTSAGFWWHNNGINVLIDGGASCRQVSSKVNGEPPNGLEQREQYFAKSISVLQAHAPNQAKKTIHPAARESARITFDPSAPINWRDPSCMISKYFTAGEATKGCDSRRIPQAGSIEEANILRLALELDKVRESWGSPIGVTSWFRPPAVNHEQGGMPNSQHILGLAADIYTMDATDQWHPRNKEFEHWLDTVAWRGRALGYGCRSNRGFTHVDLRPDPNGDYHWNY